MTLGQVIVFAKDLAKMRAFYRDALGLATVEESTGVSLHDAGGVIVTLHEIPAQYAAAITIADPPAARSNTPIKLQFYADNVRAARDRVRSNGGQTMALDEGPAGAVSCDCLDPEGNVFRIANRR